MSELPREATEEANQSVDEEVKDKYVSRNKRLTQQVVDMLLSESNFTHN